MSRYYDIDDILAEAEVRPCPARAADMQPCLAKQDKARPSQSAQLRDSLGCVLLSSALLLFVFLLLLHQPIPCRFLTDAVDLGFLHEQNVGEDEDVSVAERDERRERE